MAEIEAGEGTPPVRRASRPGDAASPDTVRGAAPNGSRGPRKRFLSPILAVLAIGAVLFGVFSLVGGHGAPTALSPIAQAAEKTASYPGARFEFSGSLTGAGLPSGFTMRGDGVINGSQDEFRMNLSLSGLPGPQGSITMTELLVDEKIYVSSPLLTGQLPGGKSWIKLGFGDWVAQGASATDPAATLEQLRAVSDDFRELGTEQVRGVETTRYSANIDTERLLGLLRSEGSGEAADAYEELFGQVDFGDVSTEVWIDGENLVRRMALSMPFGFLGQQATMSFQFEFFDFGTSEPISAPPDSQVHDAGELGSDGSVSGLFG